MRQTAGSRIRCVLATLAVAVMPTSEVWAAPVAAKAPVEKYLSRARRRGRAPRDAIATIQRRMPQRPAPKS